MAASAVTLFAQRWGIFISRYLGGEMMSAGSLNMVKFPRAYKPS